jgi:hypothetical protein
VGGYQHGLELTKAAPQQCLPPWVCPLPRVWLLLWHVGFGTRSIRSPVLYGSHGVLVVIEIPRIGPARPPGR